jgi:hypothetical protein
MSDAPTTAAPAAPTPSASSSPAAEAPKPAAASTTAAPPNETPAEKKARTLRLKVDGVEEQVNLDEMPDEELQTQLQLARAARKRMQEAAEARKEKEATLAKFQQILQLGKQDPRAALEAVFGVNPREWAESYLRDVYQEEDLPEPERKARALQRELEARDAKLREIEEAKAAEEKSRQEAETAKQQEALVKQQFEQYEKEYHAAMDKHGLPYNRETAYLFAQIGKLNLEHGIDLTTDQIAYEVKKRLSGTNQAVLRNLKGAALLSYLGDDVVKEIVRMSIEKVRAPKSPAKPFEPPAPQNTSPLDDLDDVPPAKRRMQSLNVWRKLSRG